MARDIATRITRLKQRRTGMDRYATLDESARIEVLAKSIGSEDWQKRVGGEKPYTRYALGAMQEVGPEETRISLETAERVGLQLKRGFDAHGRSVEFRLQGSVRLNVHIRRYSDVDLLALDEGFRTYHTEGVLARAGHYRFPSADTSVGRLSKVRGEAEAILRAAYPAATVDTTGSKAINVSGGSLARPVDVVPSHWYETTDYQASLSEVDRAVTILDKRAQRTIDNWPFRHIDRVARRCDATLGGVRKAIRLAKNVRCDAEADGTDIALPSFDVAGLMYHADQNALIAGSMFELAILAETQRWLSHLRNNRVVAEALRTPDGTRCVIDTAAKFEALGLLSKEMDDLLQEVAREQAPWLGPNPTLEICRSTLSTVAIARAA